MTPTEPSQSGQEDPQPVNPIPGDPRGQEDTSEEDAETQTQSHSSEGIDESTSDPDPDPEPE